jgi:hypothetical protein
VPSHDMSEHRIALLRSGSEMLKRISRTSSGDDVEGFVLAVGSRWVLVATLSDSIYIDGFAVFPVGDVLDVEDRSDEMRFVRRALALQRSWPPPRPPVPLDLDDTVAMVKSIAAVAPVVTLFTERIDDDVCFVGIPMNVKPESLFLREIRYDATWRAEPSEWSFADITRIEFADRYSGIIYAVATESEPAPN